MAEDINSVKDSYKIDANQYVYDYFSSTDFKIIFSDIYIKDIEKKVWESKKRPFLAKGGETTKAMLARFTETLKNELDGKPEKGFACVDRDISKSDNNIEKEGQVEVVWEESTKQDGEKINVAKFGEEIALVVECSTQKKAKLKVKLVEDESSESKIFNDPMKFLIDGEEKIEIEFNIVPETRIYSQKMRIRPKDKNEFRIINTKLKKIKDKKTNIFFEAEVSETNDTVVWPGNITQILPKKAHCLKGSFAVKAVPVIVIDPGHGYTTGSTGADAKLFTYYINGKTYFNESKKPNGNFAMEVDTREEFEEYINNGRKKILYNSGAERSLVYLVSCKLKESLVNKDFEVLLTRDFEKKKGNDDRYSRNKRIDLANNIKADYFISIHADGSISSETKGSHAIYSKNDKIGLSKELAIDILSKYDVVAHNKGTPKLDVRDVRILTDRNHTMRKVLVELGYLTNPKEAKILFDNINDIAAQLEAGLLINIDKFYDY